MVLGSVCGIYIYIFFFSEGVISVCVVYVDYFGKAARLCKNRSCFPEMDDDQSWSNTSISSVVEVLSRERNRQRGAGSYSWSGVREELTYHVAREVWKIYFNGQFKTALRR